MSRENLERPNIIYLLSDQHRHAAMTHVGDVNVRTPAMDKLAEEGVSMERAYANCPICVPSRGTIFTGRHAHANGVSSNYSTLYPMMPTSAKELSAAGYHTCYIGKWHLDDRKASEQGKHLHFDGLPINGGGYVAPEYRGGFEDWYQGCAHDHKRSYYFQGNERTPHLLKEYETDGYADLAIDYLQRYESEKPLFMVWSVCPPHGPFEAPDRNLRFDPRKLEVPPNFSEVTAGELADYARDLGHVPRSWREYLAIYYAMVENLDENIARIIATLDSTSRFRNTIVAYFSDHGEFGGSHGRMYRKEHPHEEGVRIPMIWRWKDKIQSGRLSQPMTSIIDMMPTTLGLAGVPVPDYCQGVDLSPFLLGQREIVQEQALLEMTTPPRCSEDYVDWKGLVTRQWKYAVYEDGTELLFDLERDPFEMNNLADNRDCAERKCELRRQLRDECIRTDDGTWPFLLARMA